MTPKSANRLVYARIRSATSRSITFVPVGPVRTRSPAASRKRPESATFGLSRLFSPARSPPHDGVAINNRAGVSAGAVAAVGSASQKQRGRTASNFAGHDQGQRLVATATAGTIRQRDGGFSAPDVDTGPGGYREFREPPSLYSRVAGDQALVRGNVIAQTPCGVHRSATRQRSTRDDLRGNAREFRPGTFGQGSRDRPRADQPCGQMRGQYPVVSRVRRQQARADVADYTPGTSEISRLSVRPPPRWRARRPPLIQDRRLRTG